ncbi:TIR domain-containing protein [Flaviramulus sp. BrNp1-15]|uniref:toll/interleukin-1 receptor domain-containing protein n=1 Tax=Flaviramulus sp. BrNp1-15 TaxID=2916754 RepID=UPI001EE959C0|nr:TIR domain-containing protein [Flaviramulus sp. BrNp1-15]ULC60383.1 TIR domain-containing protein [Flaviramulus sp. BrNp1-15]
MEYKYQVALSFAGEDREYVNKVAELLKENGISVFYDKFEQVDLWGKDLGIHFDYIYRRQSQYFIPFISENYEKKIWTNYEVRTAIARAIENKEEYILPVRFDDTELPGIRSTLGYLDIRNLSEEELANAIIQKLGAEPNIPLPEKNEPKSQKSIYLSTYIEASEFYGIVGVNIGVTVTNQINGFRYFGPPIFKLSKPYVGNADTFQLFDAMQQISFPKRMEYGEQYQINYKLKKGFIDSMREFRGQDVTLTAFVSTTVGEKFHSNEMNIDMLFSTEKE